MLKHEFVREISRKTGVPASDVDLVINAMGDVIVNASKDNDKIALKPLGIIHFRKHKPKKVGGLRGGTYQVLERVKPFFKISHTIYKNINANKTKQTASEKEASDCSESAG